VLVSDRIATLCELVSPYLKTQNPDRLHKGLAAQLDLTTYETKIFDRFSIQSSAGTSDTTGGDSESVGQDFAERLGKEAVYVWMYPNLMINRYGSTMDTNWVMPITHDRTLVIIDFYFQDVDGPEARDFIEKSMAASEVVQQEDISISESVQRGLCSTSYDRGRYSALKEMGEHHFHRLLAQDFRALMKLSEKEPTLAD
jgi:choline monooxygenase